MLLGARVTAGCVFGASSEALAARRRVGPMFAANADQTQRQEAERKLAAEQAPVKSEAEQLRELDKLAKPARMAAAIASYCFCSASLLVINKVAVHKVLSLRAHPALPRSQA